MKLVDLIDLELQLIVDEDVDQAQLKDRDRSIYLAIPESAREDRHRLLAAWLAGLRQGGLGAELGSGVLTGYRLLAYALIAVGALAGASAAGALLYYDGRVPVNIGGFLLAIVGGQLFLLIALAVGIVLSWWLREVPIVSDLQAVLRAMAKWLEPTVERVGRHWSEDVRHRWAVARSRLRTRSRLYRPVERWLLIELSQTLGIAFNVGVLMVCLRLIYFTDLAFGWSTTAEALDVATMHSVVETLSLPWGWLLPDAVPTLELVEQSRFSRLQGGFQPGVTDLLVGKWWRFLVAAVVTYGFAPRVGLWAIARSARASALARLPLDTPDIRRLIHRLRTPRVETQADAPPPPSAAVAQKSVESMPAPEKPPPGEEALCTVVRWRQVPADPNALDAALQRTFGYRSAHTLDAGGLDISGDEASQRSAGQAGDAVVVVAEAWEAPDKGIRRFLHGLRVAVGPERPIYVALVGEGAPDALAAPDDEDVVVWRDRLTLLEDPYLGVQPLETA